MINNINDRKYLNVGPPSTSTTKYLNLLLSQNMIIIESGCQRHDHDDEGDDRYMEIWGNIHNVCVAVWFCR